MLIPEGLQSLIPDPETALSKPAELNEDNFLEACLFSNVHGSRCPTSQSLVAFMEGTVDSKINELIRTHLIRCTYCSELYDRVLSFERMQVAPAASEHYEILDEVGRGGMGIVYRARHRETLEIVALKIIRPETPINQRVLERFENEIAIARGINHRNICRAYEFQSGFDSAYITMEFIDGESLRSRLERAHVLSLSEALDVATQISDGLFELHNRKIVHRDIKPENTMLDSAGTVKLTDFGVARLVDPDATVTAAAVGTPGYMAPEQVEGRTVDHRTDIYALGVVLYETVIGHHPCRTDNSFSVATRQIQDSPGLPRESHPRLPSNLEEIILKCMKRDPRQRFQSACELKSALLNVTAQNVNAGRLDVDL
jgi:serine/threonine-protein kinase